MLKKISIIVLFVIVVFGAVFLLMNKFADEPNSAELITTEPLIINQSQEIAKTQVEIDPVQCLENPWELDWRQSHADNYFSYPRDLRAPGTESEEMEIIKNYYQKQGITIYDVSSTEWLATSVCEACSCPQGYTLNLLVSNSDVDKMLDFGYKITE